MNNDNEYDSLSPPEVVKAYPMYYGLYQDLPRYLNEMLNEIPDKKDKDLIIQNINTYYDSLNKVLNTL